MECSEKGCMLLHKICPLGRYYCGNGSSCESKWPSVLQSTSPLQAILMRYDMVENGHFSASCTVLNFGYFLPHFRLKSLCTLLSTNEPNKYYLINTKFMLVNVTLINIILYKVQSLVNEST